AYFQWRAASRLADISTALSTGRAFAALPAGAALALGESAALSNVAVEQSSGRLVGLVQLLEKRIAELEHTSASPLKEVIVSTNGNGQGEHTPDPVSVIAAGDKAGQVAALLESGQTLLSSDRAEEALQRFDEVLAMVPNHAEALVKKGAALEKLRQPQEALECYDKAISVDSSMTIAYLHKGGLCNRLERYGEAMECYERALHTQEKKRAA